MIFFLLGSFYPKSFSLCFRLLDLDIRKNSQKVLNLWIPPTLLSSTEHQERVGEVRVETHADMPQSMSLRVHRPLRYPLAEHTVAEPAHAPHKDRGNVPFGNPFSRGVLGVNVVLVHPRDAEKAEDHVVDLESDAKPEVSVDCSKGGTVEEEESGHGASVMPVW